ncbi:hypothetical protein BCR34DRAFT_496755 [Clohesyomyces aquaticus]|uniref:DUF6594 domain-containing protein n=1 Tax=Clohesyomyces aquaticus TaxID=1231657 RepID=A0A1Y1YHV4_9PLEO|nr:hypothetical protein BCR34DRAFT_496755 [Clohesyomyces aquaticus]
MQLYNDLFHIQNELARIKADLGRKKTTTGAQMSQLKRIMHDYANAIRDYEYMNQLTILPDLARNDNRIFLEVAFPELGSHPTFPFDTAYRTLNRNVVRKSDVVREILRKYLLRRLTWSPAERKANKVGYNKGDRPETYSLFVDRLARFIIAVGGGAALVVPMLIMSFHASRTKSLITVSISVVIFALSLSLGFSTDNKDTLTATATYAAVLVVFVGSSNVGP